MGLACGHVYKRLSLLMVEVGEPSPLWVGISLGRQVWAVYEKRENFVGLNRKQARKLFFMCLSS